MDVKVQSRAKKYRFAMVKFKCSMNLPKQSVSFPRPSPMKALTAGFDAISAHLNLVLFSICLDLLLWLGPRIGIVSLLSSALEQMRAIPTVETPELLEQLQSLIQNLNLFSFLRTYPVGVPSLMASRLSLDTPAGAAIGWDISSAAPAFGVLLIFTLAGLAAGTLFFSVVAQSALTGKVIWMDALSQWPRACLQVGLLALTCFLLILAAFLPFSCLMAFIISGSGFGQVGYLILLVFGGFIIWLFAPLVFSPHGIFVNQANVLASILRGFYLTRLTLPTTSLMFLIFLVLSEGLDILWNIPSNSSWLMLLGIVGHAFVTTSLLAASFVYYHDAEVWVNELIKEVRLSSA